MGTAGYAGSEPKWEKEDLAAEAAGLNKPFSDIHDKRARSWSRARVVCNKKTGFVPTLVRSEDLEAYKKLVEYDAKKQEGTFSGDVFVGGWGQSTLVARREYVPLPRGRQDATGSWRTSVQLKKLRKSSMKERCKKKMKSEILEQIIEELRQCGTPLPPSL
jgi:hypothetical protein